MQLNSAAETFSWRKVMRETSTYWKGVVGNAPSGNSTVFARLMNGLFEVREACAANPCIVERFECREIANLVTQIAYSVHLLGDEDGGKRTSGVEDVVIAIRPLTWSMVLGARLSLHILKADYGLIFDSGP
jgi:hypothetical protein